MDAASVPSPAPVDAGVPAPRSRSRSGPVGWVVLAALAFLVVAGVVLGALRGPASYDLDTPEGTVQAYVQAVLDGRWVDARDLLAGELRPRCGIADLRGAWVQPPLTVHLDDVEVTGDLAEVRVRLRALATPAPLDVVEVDRGSIEVFDLTRASGQWRLTGEPWPIYDCRGW